MTAVKRISPPDWMGAGDTRRLFEALRANGAEARFVGGCVRDAILGRAVTDLDVATDAIPDEVMSLLGKRSIHVVPTGIEHGTVTAIPDHRPFQITTLRRDVETDGRHAVVSYTDDWAEDASRRDFTMNAMSADLDGTVYDYTGGLEDLSSGHVRFIGDAADRIAEDYLRILRYFRFQATYGKTGPDREALAACAAAATHIQELSGERLWQEFARILAAPAPGDIAALMEETRVLPELIPVRRRLDVLRALTGLESMVGREPDAVLRLSALVRTGQKEMSQIAARFRLSRADTSRLLELNTQRGATRPDMPDLALRRTLYVIGAGRFQDLILLDWATAIADDTGSAAGQAMAWKNVWDATCGWTAPEFPLSGSDVKALGVPEGPEIGEFITSIEDWWVDQSFRPDREACLDRLRQQVRRQGYR